MDRKKFVVTTLIVVSVIVAVFTGCANPSGSEYSRMVGEVRGSGTIQGTSVSFDTYADSSGPGAVYSTDNEAFGYMRILITQPIDSEGGYAGIAFRYEGIPAGSYTGADAQTSGLLEPQIMSSIYEELFGYREEIVDDPLSVVTIEQNDETALRGNYSLANTSGDSISGDFTFWVERFENGWPRY